MKYYEISYPRFDEEQQKEVHVSELISEKRILDEYYPQFLSMARKVNKEDECTPELCIEDFRTVHWANFIGDF